MADYESAFDSESETEKKRKEKRNNLVEEVVPKKKGRSSKGECQSEFGKDEGQRRRFHFISLDAYSRHKILINEYLLTHPGSTDKLKRDVSRDKSELDVLKANHQFLWDEDDHQDSWAKRVAKKYYDKLFKEYCICDLSRFKENKIAMRWRIEKEVVDGKGQFICGEKMCQKKNDLTSYEVNFGYVEHDEKKNALVKLRLCQECAKKLNYHHKRKEAKKKKKESINKNESEKFDSDFDDDYVQELML